MFIFCAPENLEVLQRLTLSEVVAAARAAYADGNLIAQNLDSEYLSDTDYAYLNARGHRCAIGAALTDETLAAIERDALQQETVEASAAGRWFLPFAPERESDIGDMVMIQESHDQWLGTEVIAATPESGLSVIEAPHASEHEAARVMAHWAFVSALDVAAGRAVTAAPESDS